MALLPPFFLDTVVAIGIGDDPAKRQWIGTGFLFGENVDDNPEINEKRYQLWLITNKHVLVGLKDIYIKLNATKGTYSKDYKVHLVFKNGRSRWVGHSNEDTDVAALSINPAFLNKEGRKYSFFRSDIDHFDKKKMIEAGISEGDRIFVLGFPMGMVDTEQQYVICRGGTIARIRDHLDNRTKDYLIDAPVFPGNSGGPVILCPSVVAIEGTKVIKQSALLGIVKSYVPYNDLAYSKQTNRPRISFEENSGLAAVESVDAILETVDRASRLIKRRFSTNKRRSKNK